MEKRPALGKGLSALIPEGGDALQPVRTSLEVDIERLEPNAYQPRGTMDEAGLQDLAKSIKTNGVIQPIIVRRVENGRYQIIAGERRWRAAQRAGLLKVPVVVKDIAPADKKRLLEMALIENIQRQELNPIEEAQAYQRLLEEFGLRQEDIAAQVGKDRSSIANHLRLLKLPVEIRENVASGTLSMGHARAIVALPNEGEQLRIARDVIARHLSVRETESLVKKHEATPPTETRSSAPPKKDVHTRAAEEQLHLALGTPVEIRRRRKGGEVVIAFGTEDELQRIYEYLTDTRKA
jgi:ParB family chromosome partitioning protein